MNRRDFLQFLLASSVAVTGVAVGAEDLDAFEAAAPDGPVVGGLYEIVVFNGPLASEFTLCRGAVEEPILHFGVGAGARLRWCAPAPVHTILLTDDLIWSGPSEQGYFVIADERGLARVSMRPGTSRLAQLPRTYLSLT